MSHKLIFLPILAHFLLIFILYIYLGQVKSRAIKDGNTDRQKAAINPKAWPDFVLKVSNNLDNQFESPAIFYLLSVIFYLTNHVNNILILIMTGYVITRYIHAYIHVTSNYVPYRYKSFVIGILILLFLTLWLALKLIGF